MNIFPFVIQVAALVCFIFAAFNLFATPKVNWGWLGLALWLFSLMVSGIELHPTMGVH
jgi:hypothetical protein